MESVIALVHLHHFPLIEYAINHVREYQVNHPAIYQIVAGDKISAFANYVNWKSLYIIQSVYPFRSFFFRSPVCSDCISADELKYGNTGFCVFVFDSILLKSCDLHETGIFGRTIYMVDFIK